MSTHQEGQNRKSSRNQIDQLAPIHDTVAAASYTRSKVPVLLLSLFYGADTRTGVARIG